MPVDPSPSENTYFIEAEHGAEMARLINTRLIGGFMPRMMWSTFIQECMRITRPGGTIRLTEGEFGISGITNSPACEKFFVLATQALKLAGLSFSCDGRNVGMTPMLGRLLRDAGCRRVKSGAESRKVE